MGALDTKREKYYLLMILSKNIVFYNRNARSRYFCLFPWSFQLKNAFFLEL